MRLSELPIGFYWNTETRHIWFIRFHEPYEQWFDVAKFSKHDMGLTPEYGDNDADCLVGIPLNRIQQLAETIVKENEEDG